MTNSTNDADADFSRPVTAKTQMSNANFMAWFAATIRPPESAETK